MKDKHIKRTVMISLFAALVCVATMVIRIPSPTGGYINPGDAVVLLASFLLGPVWGAVAAAIGSAMADIFSGYAVYAPATFIIKGLMALAAGNIVMIMKNRKTLSMLIAGIIAEAIMIVGYLVFTAFVLGLGAGALAEVSGNLVQGIFGIVAGSALYGALMKIPYVTKMTEAFKEKAEKPIKMKAAEKK
ncbi:MAG: ECF transporter S component [Clostridia bacterium]|nr:ECF transporter S component [Clostridia bacterium]